MINSAIVKLGKLMKAGHVYRGVSGGVLPPHFWTPNAFNVRGGIENGFMSTTRDRKVAMQYASGGGAGMVFEASMGMLDRGADLRWLSQYPGESEILFGPLTGLEVKSSRVEGACLVVEVRISVNLASATIEQVVAKMQTANLKLIDLLTDEFRFIQAPARVTDRLKALRATTAGREPHWFHQAANYRFATNEALDERSAALRILGDDDTWADEGDRGSDGVAVVARMLRAASLCAAAGEVAEAVDVMRIASKRSTLGAKLGRQITAALDDAGAEADEDCRWRLEAATELILHGALEPWPCVIAALVHGGGKRATRAFGRLLRAICEQAPRVAKRAGAGDRFAVGCNVLVLPARASAHSWKAAEVSRRFDGADAEGADGESRPVEVRMIIGGSSRTERPDARRMLAYSPNGGGIGAVLRRAAAEGYSALVTALLSAGVSFRESDGLANTALHAAAARGQRKVCQLLLAAGASCDAKNKQELSPSELALIHRHTRVHRLFCPSCSDTDIVELEPEIGVNIDNADGDECADFIGAGGVPALLCAAATGELAVDDDGRLTIRGTRLDGIDVDVACAPSKTVGSALSIGDRVEGNWRDQGQWYNGVVDKVTETAESVCHVAIAYDDGDYEADVPPGRVRRAESSSTSDAAEPGAGVTALHVAARRGCTEAVRALLFAGAAVDARTRRGVTPLLMAAEAGAELETVVALLDAHASESAVHAEGDTPLMGAAMGDHTHVVVELLKRGASVNQARADGMTALMAAARHGHHASASLLVEAKADPGMRRSSVSAAEQSLLIQTEFTALHFACRYGHTQVAAILVEAGAEIDPRSRSGWSPLQYAGQFGHTDALRGMIKLGADVNHLGDGGWHALFDACMNGHDESVLALLVAGANVNASRDNGFNGLLFAAQNGHVDAARAMARHGADLEKFGGNGRRTALQIAATNADVPMLQMLLDAGAKPDGNRESGTALSIALGVGSSEAAELLLSYGADAEITMKQARESGFDDPEMLALLERHM